MAGRIATLVAAFASTSPVRTFLDGEIERGAKVVRANNINAGE